MGFARELSAGVKKHMTSLKKAYDERLSREEAKTKSNLEKARTKSEQKIAIERFKTEKAKIRTEYYEAVLATQKAETALKKARKEAGDLTPRERVSKAGTSFGRSAMATYRSLSGKPAPRRRKKSTKRV